MSDPDYVAASPHAPPTEAVATRRACAMDRWMKLRTDADFTSAVTHIRTADSIAWHCFWERNRVSVVAQMRVDVGEPLAPTPLALSVDRAVLKHIAEDQGDALIAALARLDFNHVMTTVQPHDPLSWHCTARTLSACRSAPHPPLLLAPVTVERGGGAGAASPHPVLLSLRKAAPLHSRRGRRSRRKATKCGAHPGNKQCRSHPQAKGSAGIRHPCVAAKKECRTPTTASRDSALPPEGSLADSSCTVKEHVADGCAAQAYLAEVGEA